jgi:hypothetical protein
MPAVVDYNVKASWRRVHEMAEEDRVGLTSDVNGHRLRRACRRDCNARVLLQAICITKSTWNVKIIEPLKQAAEFADAKWPEDHQAVLNYIERIILKNKHTAVARFVVLASPLKECGS